MHCYQLKSMIFKQSFVLLSAAVKYERASFLQSHFSIFLKKEYLCNSETKVEVQTEMAFDKTVPDKATSDQTDTDWFVL